jgi:uncharacterized protein YjaZ
LAESLGKRRLSHIEPILTGLIAFALTATLTACGTSQSERVFTHNEQEFRIIRAYEGQARYLKEAQSNPDNLEGPWSEYVVDAYREDCIADSEYKKLAEESLSEPIRNLARLSSGVETLRGSDVAGVIEGALKDSSRKLPGPDTTICIFISDDRRATMAYEEGGAALGVTAGAGKILLFVSPEGDWREWTAYSIAHEYHHSVWTERHLAEAQPLELADYLIFEGRADSFAHLIYPDKTAPWTQALTPPQEAEQWEVMQENLESTDRELWSHYAFGGSGSPRWTLYTIGFHIVQSYLDNPPPEI